MAIIKQNAGLEIDLKKIKVSFQVLDDQQHIKIKGSRTFDNTMKGFEALEQWLHQKRTDQLPVHLTLEATGVYGENVSYFFNDRSDFIIHVVLPNMSKAFFKSHNFKSKTDDIDARGLGMMGLERQLAVWKPASPQMRSIKKIVRQRIRLVRQRTIILNQMHAERASYKPNAQVLKQSEKLLTFITKQIDQFETQLTKLVNKDPQLDQRINNVCTAKGVGFITAISVVAELNGFEHFENRPQLVCYAGYDIVKRESGSSVRGKTRISKKGNAYIRAALYMAALSAVQHDPHHKAYYQRIVAKTGIKMKGNVAIQRKLLLLIYTLFKNNVPYNPSHPLEMQQRLVKPQQPVPNPIA